jgi:hypothetical protein
LAFPGLPAFWKANSQTNRKEGSFMRKAASLILFLVTIAGAARFTLAQSSGGGGGDACGVLACGAGAIIYILIIALALAVPIILIIFVIKFIKRDATDRGMPNADSIKWLGLLALLGLLIYLLQRPQGNVLPCPSCGKNRMQGLPACPHCGNA